MIDVHTQSTIQLTGLAISTSTLVPHCDESAQFRSNGHSFTRLFGCSLWENFISAKRKQPICLCFFQHYILGLGNQLVQFNLFRFDQLGKLLPINQFL